MNSLEMRMKLGLVAFGLVFMAAETPYYHQWIARQGETFWEGLWAVNFHVLDLARENLLYLMTVIDFGAFALLVWLWMLWDAHRRAHPWRPWLWLPVFILTPTLGLIGYLITRRGWQFPFPEPDRPTP